MHFEYVYATWYWRPWLNRLFRVTCKAWYHMSAFDSVPEIWLMPANSGLPERNGLAQVRTPDPLKSTASAALQPASPTVRLWKYGMGFMRCVAFCPM